MAAPSSCSRAARTARRRRRGRSRMSFPANVPPQIVIAVEHYGRLARTLDKKVPVTVELTVQNRFIDDQPGFNVLAELPGTDKADEIVMLGAHFDSWHGATGATDNGVGSAIMLEAMRILKASGLKMRRTVRLGALDRRRAGIARFARLRQRQVRGPRDHDAEARAREAGRATSTSTTAPAPSAASICRETRRSRRSSPRG